ncbi:MULTISPECIES: Lcl domain-containing protein [Thiorhodovibrio]|uniref:Lcl domain-containing protein n=1 Tax=Thiorhodovibrio TaxID=61593 RepID=UPI00389B1C9F|nr:hypothetical protein [Thiorhodovibrio winogradskyi]
MPLAGCFLTPASGPVAMLRAIILCGLLLLSAVAAAQQQQEPSCGRGAEDDFDEERWKPTDDGTVGDEENGLIWKRCTEGLRGDRCSEGRLKYVTWEKALEIAEKSTFAGFDDWRIPKLDELRQIIQPGCQLPAVNLSLFPYTPSGWFWYDSAEDNNSPRAGQLGFAFGEDFSANQRNVVHLRLVREVPEEPAADDAAQAGAAQQGGAEPAPGAAPPTDPAGQPPADPPLGGPPPAGQPGDAQAGQGATEPQPGDNDQGQAGQDALPGADPGAAGQVGQNAPPGADGEAGAPAPTLPTADQPADPNADPAAAQNAGGNQNQPPAQAGGVADGAANPSLLPGPAGTVAPAGPEPGEQPAANPPAANPPAAN